MTLPAAAAVPVSDTPAGGSPAAAPPRTVAGWALRLALGAASLAASLAAMVPAPPFEAASLLGVLLVAASIGAALAPGSVMPLAVLVGVIVFRMATPGAVFDAPLLALIALAPLIHQLAGVCAPVPARSACSWRALRPAAIRYAITVMPVECAAVVALAVGL